jgi:transcriptional regulator with XRE-family HTH domain
MPVMPTRVRRLVIELKQFREAAGLTGEQVAEQMGWSGRA